MRTASVLPLGRRLVMKKIEERAVAVALEFASKKSWVLGPKVSTKVRLRQDVAVSVLMTRRGFEDVEVLIEFRIVEGEWRAVLLTVLHQFETYELDPVFRPLRTWGECFRGLREGR